MCFHTVETLLKSTFGAGRVGWHGPINNNRKKDNIQPLTEGGHKVLKKHFNALGKIFEREIDGTLPFQSKAKIYAELEADGMVEKYTRVFGGRFPLAVTGWVLTQRGRLLYCQAC